MPKKRNTPFQHHHAVEFGLRISERGEDDSTTVVSVACRFCEVFGKEEPVEVGRKRCRSSRVKYFKGPFRKENYLLHIERMHGVKWAQYSQLDEAAKKAFFNSDSFNGSQTTKLHAFGQTRSRPLHALIDKDIVDVIIGEMMFHPEDMEGVSRSRLVESFVPTLDSSEETDASGVSRYAINVSTPKQFSLVAQYLAAGLSFRQVTKVITDSCSEGLVSLYARFICAMNLQSIAELLRKCWAFSIALDMATHMATGYCDVRIRFCHECTLHDFHLLSIPVHERHTGAIIFDTFSKAMDALYPDWSKKIVGVSTDGEQKMTGQHEGVVTRIQRVANPGFMQIWCGAHQLDLCMQSFYLAIPEAFYSTVTSLVAYLRRQQKFISDERSQCPLICDTRWLNMIKVTTWFDKHRLAVTTYLEEKKPACMPDESWWILLLVVHEISGIAAISYRSLQGHGVLLCNQHQTLKQLIDEIILKTGAVRILSEAQRGLIDETTHQLSKSGNYSVSFAAISGFIADMGMFAKDRLTAMDSGNRDMLLRSTASAILKLLDDISVVIAERTEDNECFLDAVPAVLPHQLVRVLPRNFCSYLQRHQERLKHTFSAEEIELIGRQHKTLCDSYYRQPDVKSSIDSFDDASSFHDAWIGFHNTYHLLQRFSGGLATIFPGTSTVESDFSVVKYEKNSNRMSLTDASLEGILHAKQYCAIRSLFV